MFIIVPGEGKKNIKRSPNLGTKGGTKYSGLSGNNPTVFCHFHFLKESKLKEVTESKVKEFLNEQIQISSGFLSASVSGPGLSAD